MTIAKYPNNPFWYQIQAFSFFHEISQFNKFEDADFKYDKRFLKFWHQNIQIEHFWSQIQAFSFFHELSQFDKFEGTDFKYDNRFSKFLSQNTQITHFGTKFRHFHFFPKFCNQTNLKALIIKRTIVLQNCSPKHLNKAFLVPNL